MSLEVLLPVSTAVRALEEGTAPVRPRARLRLILTCAAVGLTSLPFIGDLSGFDRTGVAGVLAPMAGFGLAATALLARTRRDLLLGESAISSVIAGLVLLLAATAHPWIPGPERRAVLVPIFGALALLALLDFTTRLQRVAVGVEVGAVRIVAALVAAVACQLAHDPIPAGAALVLALLPAGAALPRHARAARRSLEVVAFLAAAALFLAPELQDAISPPRLAIAAPTVWAFLDRLAGIGLGLLAGLSVAFPEADSSDAGSVAGS